MHHSITTIKRKCQEENTFEQVLLFVYTFVHDGSSKLYDVISTTCRFFQMTSDVKAHNREIYNVAFHPRAILR